MKNPPKIILCCLIGNLLEWFEFTIYVYAIPMIADQIMPPSDKVTSLIFSYSIFAIGFFIRPLAAILFGYIGDCFGRKRALVISSVMMAMATVSIGLIPNYAKIGFLAPVLLIVCRIVQSIAVGGEFAGTMVYLIEQAPPHRKGFYTAWTDVGCTSGVLLGSVLIVFLTQILSPEAFLNYGWRIPFLSGLFLAFLSIYIRRNLPEPEEFIHMKREKMPLKYLFTEIPKTFFYSVTFLAIHTLGYYILTVYIPNQNILLGKISIADSYSMNNLILIIYLFSCFIASVACDYMDEIKIFCIGMMGCLLTAYPMFYYQDQLLYLGLFSAMLGICFGPRSLFFMKIFPAPVRFTGIAVCLSLGNGIFGGTAPLLASFLTQWTNRPEMPALLVIAAAILSLISLYQLRNILNNLFYPKEISSYRI